MNLCKTVLDEWAALSLAQGRYHCSDCSSRMYVREFTHCPDPAPYGTFIPPPLEWGYRVEMRCRRLGCMNAQLFRFSGNYLLALLVDWRALDAA